MRVWRLCKARYAAAAFSGEGARLYSGRWNPVGVSMVYTSTSLALASLECFVHLDPSVAPDDLVSVTATIPEDVAMEGIEVADLPGDWRVTDNPTLQRLGSDWIAAQKSVALEVPSVVVDGDWNVLLNPAHPDFGKIVMDAPKPWSFDQRMFKASGPSSVQKS
ncbi:MAG TPA: RES family NAD+ phosphorylase [Silvibacterium sp.]|nr:RES family NAD+ phosphorylase [Silvibacterium sp.]